MKVELTGSIRRIGSRIDASGDIVNTIILEIFGPVEELNSLMKESLLITLENESSARRD